MSTAQPVSRGIRTRFGRPVVDADTAIMLHITKSDLRTAQAKRRNYDVDEPENFGECVLATCIAKSVGSQVCIMRKHAYVAMPDSKVTFRYELSDASCEFVRLNDEARFDEIPVNAAIKLKAPTLRRQLATMREAAKTNANYRATRGSGRKQTLTDPYRGVLRNGIYSAEA